VSLLASMFGFVCCLPVCVRACARMPASAYAYMSMDTSLRLHVHEGMHKFLCRQVNVYIGAHMFVWAYVGTFVYVSVDLGGRARQAGLMTCIWHVFALHLCMYVALCVCVCIYIYTIHVYMYIYICKYIDA
jgi:hypothetical protein